MFQGWTKINNFVKTSRMKYFLFNTCFCALMVLMSIGTTHATPLPVDTNKREKKARVEGRQLRGDVNGDGSRTISDVSLVVDYILTGEGSFETSLGDMDNNGVITVMDVTILVDIILGGQYIDPDNPDLPIDDPQGDDPANGL